MSTTTSIPVRSTVPPWPVVGTLCQRELVRFIRQKNRVFGALGTPIIFWLLFSMGLGPIELGFAHFFPGTIVMILLFTAIFATISIIEDRQEGFLQGVLVAPIPRWSMVLGKVLGVASIAMLQGVLFLILGWLTVEEVDPTWWGLVASVVLMSVVSVALTALGFVIAWGMDSSQAYHAVMNVLLFPMWLLSGAFFPTGTSGVLGWIVAVNPLTYGVAGLRHYLQQVSEAEVSGMPSLILCWLGSLLFAAVMMAAAWWIAGTRSSGDLR